VLVVDPHTAVAGGTSEHRTHVRGLRRPSTTARVARQAVP
jgi:hypothetical protein